jgi:hypothetical protein
MGEESHAGQRELSKPGCPVAPDALALSPTKASVDRGKQMTYSIDALAPGPMDTQGMHAEAMDHGNVEVHDGGKLMLGDILAHRLGTADATATTVPFLASPGVR